MALVKAVQCDNGECEKLMKSDTCEYFTIMGNVFIGQSGGLVGNNLDDGGKVTNTVYYCVPCFSNMIHEAAKSKASTPQRSVKVETIGKAAKDIKVEEA